MVAHKGCNYISALDLREKTTPLKCEVIFSNVEIYEAISIYYVLWFHYFKSRNLS